jgi:hypothetical protein
MIYNRCLFCGGNGDEPGHRQRCDGRQGQVEAQLARAENFARATDPETSHAAARSVTEDTITELQRAIDRVIRDAFPRPLSDEAIRAHLSAQGILSTPSGCRTRRSELLHAGYIVDSGQRGWTMSGRKTILWTVAHWRVASGAA